jgi:hypothetical protein
MDSDLGVGGPDAFSSVLSESRNTRVLDERVGGDFLRTSPEAGLGRGAFLTAQAARCSLSASSPRLELSQTACDGFFRACADSRDCCMFCFIQLSALKFLFAG